MSRNDVEICNDIPFLMNKCPNSIVSTVNRMYILFFSGK